MEQNQLYRCSKCRRLEIFHQDGTRKRCGCGGSWEFYCDKPTLLLIKLGSGFFVIPAAEVPSRGAFINLKGPEEGTEGFFRVEAAGTIDSYETEISCLEVDLVGPLAASRPIHYLASPQTALL